MPRYTKLFVKPDDDGRVIVNMDVEGMRWHDRKVRRDQLPSNNHSQGPQMTPSQTRQYTWYSLVAASLIVLVFSATWVLFTLFCIYVWFR